MSHPVAIAQSIKSLITRCTCAFVCRIFAFIGFMWIFGNGAVLIIAKVKPYGLSGKPAATFVSRDGRFKAVVFLDSGGGPATSYCETSIYVTSVEKMDSELRTEKNLAYSASCGGMSELHWERNLIWKSPNLLQIDFDPNFGTSGRQLTIRNVQGINIEFGFRKGGDAF